MRSIVLAQLDAVPLRQPDQDLAGTVEQPRIARKIDSRSIAWQFLTAD
jgi:hypothetical protein